MRQLRESDFNEARRGGKMKFSYLDVDRMDGNTPSEKILSSGMVKWKGGSEMEGIVNYSGGARQAIPPAIGRQHASSQHFFCLPVYSSMYYPVLLLFPKHFLHTLVGVHGSAHLAFSFYQSLKFCSAHHQL